MSDARWRQHLRVEPLLAEQTVQGAQITSAVTASIFIEAESLGDRPILTVQISFIIDIFPDRRVQREFNINYLDEALFELYCDQTPDDDILTAFIDN